MTDTRLFFALWPGDDVRARIVAAAAPVLTASAGRQVPAARLHLTLAFLGAVAPARVADVVAAAARCRGRAFDLTLDALGHWPQPRVLWLGCRATPPALTALVTALWDELGACGLARPARDFAPHVTLARGVARPPWPPDRLPQPPPVHWPVRQFALVRSHSDRAGLPYTPLHDWPLRADRYLH